jgi:putative aldouronate transport system permease protein
MEGARNNTTSPDYKKTWRYDLKRHKVIYLMFLAVFIYYFIFHYVPMFGIVIGFQKYRPAKGIMNSEWVGLKNFVKFFTGPYAFRLIRNTLVLNLLLLCFSFTAPIIFALMLNEMRPGKYKSLMQTISYMPHFVSAVVVCGLLLMFTQSNGIITSIFHALGLSEKTFLLSRPEYFRPLYVMQDIWQELGWGSIIYLATVSNVDMNLYEAADIDGAGRFRKIWSITIPALIPVIVVQLIMRIGSLMSLGSGKVILLYRSSTYETADIVSSYVYRAGLLNQDYSLGTAVDLCNSVVNIILLFLANTVSRRLTEQSLW